MKIYIDIIHILRFVHKYLACLCNSIFLCKMHGGFNLSCGVGDLVMLTELNSKSNIRITGKRVNMSLENKIFKYDKKE